MFSALSNKKIKKYIYLFIQSHLYLAKMNLHLLNLKSVCQKTKTNLRSFINWSFHFQNLQFLLLTITTMLMCTFRYGLSQFLQLALLKTFFFPNLLSIMTLIFFILVKNDILINLIKVEEWDLNTDFPHKTRSSNTKKL